MSITRNHTHASSRRFDVIIIGGGMYGVALALNASRRGLSSLLVEKHDFGWSTTYNHLRTIHGGLRYLQNLDLPRFFESVSERSRFMKEFPGLVRPLPCLMPLYGNGPYRPSVFRVALGLNDTLSRSRNKGAAPGQELQKSRVLTPEQVIARFPLVDRKGLKGGAVWYDAAMPSSQLVLMEMLNRACAAKASALNYTEATELIIEEHAVNGVRCRDLESGVDYDFSSTTVINAAGPWCRTFAASFHDDDPNLFRYSIAWNVLFNKTALSDHSIAVKAKRPGSRMYFVHGFNNVIMGGTVHAPWSKVEDHPMPAPDEVAAYIDDLNLSVPGLHLRAEDVLQIFAGLLPVRTQGTDVLANREVIKDHSATGGPRGVFSVSGVKLTTARLVAEKVLQQLFPQSKPIADEAGPYPQTSVADPFFSLSRHTKEDDESQQALLRKIIAEQGVVHLDDLIVRRTSIGDNPQRALATAPAIADLFEWNEQKRAEELQRLELFYKRRGLAGKSS